MKVSNLCIFLITACVGLSNSFSFLPTAQRSRVASSSTSSSRFRSKNDNDNNDNDNDNDNNDNDDSTWMEESDNKNKRRDLIYNTIGLGLIGASGWASLSLFNTNVYTPSGFQRISPTQFIAALGDPQASQGSGASEWGLWGVDPGPRGVWLRDYSRDIVANENQIAPAGWKFDENDWWLEEHGLIMEAPKFPLKEGRYLVTGGRMVTTGLTIDAGGNWKLDEGATLYDVTHLPCRSARYTPDPTTTAQGEQGSPLTANPRDFPVAPGAIMPSVPGCKKQDYAVLFVVGKAA